MWRGISIIEVHMGESSRESSALDFIRGGLK